MSHRTPPSFLYIDDDAGVGRLVRNELQRHGFAVTVASSGRDGLALAATGAFDIIGLDHFLQDETGIDILAALKSLPNEPAVIYVTGTEDINIALAALKAGASDFVIKDVQGHFLTLLRRAVAAAHDQMQLHRAKQRAEDELRAANARLEKLAAKQAVLLREMNHRIGNSLQMIVSMIRLQAAATADADARDVLRQAAERVVAIAQVHQRLYTSDDVRYVQMRHYLRPMLAELETTAAERGCSLAVEVDDVSLATDQAISIGVIASELVTNALKYAYPQGGGPVRVSLRATGPETYELSVEDDGIGSGEAMKSQGTGVGSRIVDAMARSLGTSWNVDSEGSGTRSTIAFTGQPHPDDAAVPVADRQAAETA